MFGGEGDGHGARSLRRVVGGRWCALGQSRPTPRCDRNGGLRGLVVGANDDMIVEAVRQADKGRNRMPAGVAGAGRGVRCRAPARHREHPAGPAWSRLAAPPGLPPHRPGGPGGDRAACPLSVAADRIGHAAMRAAGLLARLAAEGIRSTAPAPAWSWRSTPRPRCDAGNCHTEGSRARITSPRSVSWSTACRSRPRGWTSPGTRRTADLPTTSSTLWSRR